MQTILSAVKQLIEPSVPLRVVHITAKENLSNGGDDLRCQCRPNAAGYYTRLPKALTELEQIPLLTDKPLGFGEGARSLPLN